MTPQDQTSAAQNDQLRDFDPVWYQAAYPDVALTHLSPEQHYLLVGRAMGRAGSAAEAAKRPTRVQPLPAAAASYFGKIAPETVPPAQVSQDSPLIPAPADVANRPRAQAYALVRPDRRSGVSLMLGKTELGRFADEASAWTLSAPAAIYAALTGVSPEGGTGMRLDDSTGGMANLVLPEADLLQSGCTSAALTQGPTRIEDIWFSDTGTLRVSIGGHPADTPQPGTGVIRAWAADAQDPGALSMVGGVSVPEAGPAFFDLTLDNPLLPVLFEMSDPAGLTRGYALLAFPSLARGGMHATERAAWQMGPNPTDEIWRLGDVLVAEYLAGHRTRDFAISRLMMRPEGATGAERLLSQPVCDWLQRIFGLGIGADAQDTPAAGDVGQAWLIDQLQAPATRGGAGGLTLSLPPQAVPTLAALVSRRMRLPAGLARSSGPYLVADAASQRPLWSVSVPMTGKAHGPDLPILSHPAAAEEITPAPVTWMAPLHLAILSHSRAQGGDLRQMLPVAPDAPTPSDPTRSDPAPAPVPVSVVLRIAHPEHALRVLDGLSRQTGIDLSMLVLEPQSPVASAALPALIEAAGPLFSGRVRPASQRPRGLLSDLDRVAADAGAGPLLLLDDVILLTDPRTVAHLLGMLAADPGAGAVSCMTLHEGLVGKTMVMAPASAGLFPAGVSLISAPRLTVIEPDVTTALPQTTYPVLANSHALCLIRPEALAATAPARAALPGRADPDLHFGLTAHAAGWRSLCTTEVRAGTLSAPARRDDIDPFGLSCLAPARWEDLLSGVTVLRELRG